MSSCDEESVANRYPSPANLEEFLPWACNQFQLEANIMLLKSVQGTYSGPCVSEKKERKTPKLKEDANVDSTESKEAADIMGGMEEDKLVHINSIYDQNGYLVQLKFFRNSIIPRALLKLILLVMPFHPNLTTISIDRGLKYDGLHELSKVVSEYKITEVILDDTMIPQDNYYILINEHDALKYLSLARCRLNDTAVEAIASRLTKSSVSILNLSSNRITDVGATYLGSVLRTNRKLTYLNLAGNMITDSGAASILNCLAEFPLSHEEITGMKAKHFAYLRAQNDFVMKHITDTCDSEKKVVKRKSLKPTSAPSSKRSKGLERALSVKNLQPSVTNNNSVLTEKAASAAKASFGPFQNPFSPEHTVIINGVTHCLGNNTLCHLNLAYNNLTYFSLKKLHKVITTQDNTKRIPKGLINVCIEGNKIPESCVELTEIDDILRNALFCTRRVSGLNKKKPRVTTKQETD